MDTSVPVKSSTSKDGRYGGEFYFYTLIAGLFTILFLFVTCRGRYKDWKNKKFAAFLNNFKTFYNLKMGDRKAKLFESLRDCVPSGAKIRLVEVGAGPGANFKYFPPGTRVICVDPNKYFEEIVISEAAKLNNGMVLEEFKIGVAEDMSFFEEGSVDVVVCTLVLCSVNDVKKSLQEIVRILKPGGRFYFIEHIAADALLKSIIQKLLSPVWTVVFECNLRSKAHQIIAEAGFSKVQAECFQATELIDTGNASPSLMDRLTSLLTPHVWGYAVK